MEVRDRSGEVIHSQLNQAGSTREIEGQPPFELPDWGAGAAGCVAVAPLFAAGAVLAGAVVVAGAVAPVAGAFWA